MAANLAATEGLPLAEHVTALLSGVLGGRAGTRPGGRASERAVSAGLPLRDVLLGVPELADALAAAGITAEQVEAALEPAGYLGATQVFIDAALAAHGGRRPMDDAERTQQGMPVRREVLGDAHVDRAVASDHLVHRAVPGLHHPVRVGRDLVPARA